MYTCAAVWHGLDCSLRLPIMRPGNDPQATLRLEVSFTTLGSSATSRAYGGVLGVRRPLPVYGWGDSRLESRRRRLMGAYKQGSLAVRVVTCACQCSKLCLAYLLVPMRHMTVMDMGAIRFRD